MIRVLLLLSAIPFTLVAVGGGPHGSQGVEQPPLRILLEIGGEEYLVDDGQQVEIELAGQRVVAGVRVQPTRRLLAAGLSFEFPSAMNYEFEPDQGLDMWTLDGGNSTVLLQSFAAGDAQELARYVLEATVRALDEDFGELQPATLRLGGRDMPALAGRVTLAGSSQLWTGCGIEVGERQMVLMLQDMVGDDGVTTTEMQGILRLLDKTFEIQK